jgi:hypothetical protein
MKKMITFCLFLMRLHMIFGRKRVFENFCLLGQQFGDHRLFHFPSAETERKGVVLPCIDFENRFLTLVIIPLPVFCIRH